MIHVSCYCLFFYASRDCSYGDLGNGISMRIEMSDTIDNNACYGDTPAGGKLSSLGQ